MANGLTLDEVRARDEFRLHIDHADVAHLITEHPDKQAFIERALIMSSIRSNVDRLCALAKTESFLNQETLDLLQTLATAADYEAPALEVVKAMSIAVAHEGRYEDALERIKALVHRAWQTNSSKSGAYHRSLLRYLHDPDIDATLTLIANQFKAPAFLKRNAASRRLTIFVSSLDNLFSPTLVALPVIKKLVEFGYEVSVVSSDFMGTSDDTVVHSIAELGVSVKRLPEGSDFARIRSALDIIRLLRADLVVYLVTPMDLIAKVVSSVGAVPAQCMLNVAYEHHCGKFVYVFQSTSIKQETITAWPGKSKYTGTFAAMETVILQARPLDRFSYKIPDDAVVLLTHGRVAKCSREYFQALATILQKHPNAYAVLAGHCTKADLARIEENIPFQTVGSRVVILGEVRNKIPQLLKTADVYLDPFPWPGGQTTIEAMWAGLPIVAMRSVEQSADDPDTYSPINSSTDAFLPEHFERAGIDDDAAYIAIASKYIADARLRREDGTQLREHVAATYTFESFMQRLTRYLDQALQLAS